MSKRSSKLISIVMVVLMLAGMLVGCGGDKVATATTTPAPASAAASAQPTAAPGTEAKLDEVTLRIYFPTEKRSATDEVWTAVAAMVKDRINAKFEISFIPFNDYTDKLMVMASSGDNYDMNFDGNWLSYPKMVNAQAYLPLNDLLPKYAPATYAALQKAGSLAAATVNGDLLAIPWEMHMNQQKLFLRWRNDLAGAAGLTYAKDSIKTIEDLDKFLHDAKAAIPADVKVWSWDAAENSPQTMLMVNRDELVDLNFHSIVFDVNDPNCKLIALEQTPGYLEAAGYTKKWVDDGIIPKNLMVDKEQASAAFRNGTLFAALSTHEWANADPGFADKAWTMGTSETYADKKAPNRSALANITCINRNAANPERALMFLDLLTTDQAVYDLVMYGIKDKTYVLNGEGADFPAGMTAANSSYLDWQGQWAWWKPQFMRPTSTYPKGFWQAEATFASQPQCVENKLDGLFFNTDAIKNEIAKRDQINTEYGKLIQYGTVDDVNKAVAEYIQKQKDAGLDKILAELQRQVDEYLASKK